MLASSSLGPVSLLPVVTVCGIQSQHSIEKSAQSSIQLPWAGISETTPSIQFRRLTICEKANRQRQSEQGSSTKAFRGDAVAIGRVGPVTPPLTLVKLRSSCWNFLSCDHHEHVVRSSNGGNQLSHHHHHHHLQAISASGVDRERFIQFLHHSISCRSATRRHLSEQRSSSKAIRGDAVAIGRVGPVTPPPPSVKYPSNSNVQFGHLSVFFCTGCGASSWNFLPCVQEAVSAVSPIAVSNCSRVDLSSLDL
ncbi:uncharacterized protein LOC129742055 [Uranotaenia lowii]|uniref:uncharacterized protein LOC129742055 n=1 Tax=Uranotaenia lowii TaxID=190385 RepID=UPI0024788035|nr:uncharacterized protein LOC129742055 [Uranotaenia lowii]